MRFSQRIGKRPNKIELEKNNLSPELRNTLWSLILELVIEPKKKFNDRHTNKSWSPRSEFFRSMWMNFFRWPIDNLLIDTNMQVNSSNAIFVIRDWYFKTDWDLALDFIEFCVNYDNNLHSDKFNKYFKREMSAYRFIDGSLVEINSKEEIVEIENAINSVDKLKSVKTHLKRAVELYANKNNPDYRNSIKESISAVEALAKIIIHDNKTTLGKALKVIERKHNIPVSLKTAFSALYGFTSDEGGIRHSLLEQDVNVEMEEARFMLIACSAFVNYLISKNTVDLYR